MLFMNLSGADAAVFKSKVREVAEHYKNNEISFLVGDLDASQGAFQVGYSFLGFPMIFHANNYQ